MITLDLYKDPNVAYKVLCLGSHCDDIEIGCGGTILKLLESYSNVICHWVVFSGSKIRAQEARRSADSFLSHAKGKKVTIRDFRESFFPFIGDKIKEYFEQLKEEFEPDVIFTHYRGDLHQDHRIVSELTWNTFRHHLIFEYEIAKYDGDLGSPNLFVHLDEAIYQEKIKNILEIFKTQESKHWFEEQTFLSLLRLRGMESNSPSKYAEAFYCRKIVVALGEGEAFKRTM